MVPTEFRVWREVDNRNRHDPTLIDGLQDEIKILRAELRRLREWITHLQEQTGAS